MEYNFFQKKKLSSFDYLSLFGYLILTVLVSNYQLIFSSIQAQKHLVMSYAFLTPLFIYVFCYKSLRNIKVFLVWLMFTIYHQFLYQSLIETQGLNFARGHAAHGLQYTVFFLLLFQLIRILHLNILGYELVGLASGSFDFDLLGERRIRWTDGLCFFIYVGLWIYGSTLE